MRGLALLVVVLVAGGWAYKHYNHSSGLPLVGSVTQAPAAPIRRSRPRQSPEASAPSSPTSTRGEAVMTSSGTSSLTARS